MGNWLAEDWLNMMVGRALNLELTLLDLECPSFWTVFYCASICSLHFVDVPGRLIEFN
jgi:hypothetical protein